MKIGYYVQGTADEAFVRGLAQRWCPQAEFAEGRFRGMSGESHRREMPKELVDLRDRHHCDVLVILTDSDTADWREVKRREWNRVPQDCQYMSIYGVADRNIECWLAIDRQMLANELGCQANDIPDGNPSGFVKMQFKFAQRSETSQTTKDRIREFVANLPRLKSWIENSKSFEDFYNQIRRLGSQRGCQIPNELDAA